LDGSRPAAHNKEAALQRRWTPGHTGIGTLREAIETASQELLSYHAQSMETHHVMKPDGRKEKHGQEELDRLLEEKAS
jgi:hypothetical protein